MPGDGMSFPGQPPKAPEEPKPLREYELVNHKGTLEIVWAHYLTFTACHINFWQSRTDNEQDTLTLCKTADTIRELKEVTP
jgi:hypothetical protein